MADLKPSWRVNSQVQPRVGEACFSDAFQQVRVEEIYQAILRDGYFVCERALRDEAVEQILEDVHHLRWDVNRNEVPNVRTPSQTFNTHCLAASKTAFDLIVSDKLTNLCRLALGPVFRLMFVRVYETRYRADQRASENQTFHVDLQQPKLTDFDGLAAMVYLTDVSDGEFQFVRGSHRWGVSYDGTPENDALIHRDHADDIVRFLMPKGTIILYHNRGVHRGAMPTVPGKRQSLSLQVNRGAVTGPPLIVDVGFLDELSEDARTLLGMGELATLALWPDTTAKHLDLKTDPALSEALDLAGLQRKTVVSPQSPVPSAPDLSPSSLARESSHPGWLVRALRRLKRTTRV